LDAVGHSRALTTLRRLARQARVSLLMRGPTKRSLAHTPVLVIDPSPDQAASERYASMLRARDHMRPAVRPCVTIVVGDATLDDERTCELVGIALALSESGVEVVVTPDDGPIPAGTDVVVVPADVTVTFDPATVPDVPTLIAWVHGMPTRWIRTRGLDWFDALLCGSSVLGDALRPLFAGSIEVFPHAVDTDLFTPPTDGARRRGFVSTVVQDVDHQPLAEAIGVTPFETATAIFDRPRWYPRSLRRFVRGPATTFERPAILRSASTAFSAAARGEVGADVVEAAALEAICCGASVVSTGDLGTGGLRSPHRAPAGGLGPLIDVPPDRQGLAADREHVERVHSQRARATRLVEIAADAARADRPSTFLAFHPNFWTHPYVGKLYRGLRSRGIRAIAIEEPRSVLDAPGLRGRSIFHQQWTAPILAGAKDRRDATQRAEAFLAQVDRLRDANVPVIWTVHNVLPHECAYPDAEVRLCTGLAERSDVIHVLNAATLAEVADLYPLPAERVREIPYCEDPVTLDLSREEARARLSLADEEVVYLAFGRVRPYKQLGRLLDAFEQHHRSHPRTRLVVAGRLERFAGSRALARRCRTQPGVVARLGHVPDDEMALLFSASDATVVSYPVLNSGVAITAIAHGCPVAAVSAGALPDVVGADGGLVFDPEDDLADVLDRLHALVTETDLRARVVGLARTRSSAAMADAFAEVVADLMRRRVAPGPRRIDHD
jgi:glycosyltransferase involved in cell wall biosynthesis